MMNRSHVQSLQVSLLALALAGSLGLASVSLAKSADEYVSEASSQFNRGDISAAEKSYRKALDVDAQHSYARLGLACSMKEQGRLGEAERELNSLVSQQPDFAAAYYLQGQVYESQGKPDKAKAAYQQYVAKSHGNIPPDPAVRLKLRKYSVL